MPAGIFNTKRSFLHYSGESSVFVLVRTMQYLAMNDKDEVIFVDAISARRSIELSWQNFRQQDRSSLSEPVAFEFAHYDLKALETIEGAQGEFNKSVQDLTRNPRHQGLQGS